MPIFIENTLYPNTTRIGQKVMPRKILIIKKWSDKGEIDFNRISALTSTSLSSHPAEQYIFHSS